MEWRRDICQANKQNCRQLGVLTDTQQVFIEDILVLSTSDTYHILSLLRSCALHLYPHFADEETDSERLLNLSVATQFRVSTVSDSGAHALLVVL